VPQTLLRFGTSSRLPRCIYWFRANSYSIDLARQIVQSAATRVKEGCVLPQSTLS